MLKKEKPLDWVITDYIVVYTRLQWSKLFHTVEFLNYTIGYDIHISLTRISRFSQEEYYDYREKPMYYKSQKRISNKDISEYLNKNKSNQNSLSGLPQIRLGDSSEIHKETKPKRSFRSRIQKYWAL